MTEAEKVPVSVKKEGLLPKAKPRLTILKSENLKFSLFFLQKPKIGIIIVIQLQIQHPSQKLYH